MFSSVPKRSLSEPERALWQAFAARLQPLRGRAALPPPAAVTIAPSPPRVPPAPVPRRTTPLGYAIEVGLRQPGLDDTSWRMLHSGRMRPQRTLDLHGRTAQAAFGALHGFLLRAQAEELRCVEIITGVGSGAEGGVLRRELPHWLSRPDLRPLVLAAAHPHRANQGSVRLLLRRHRAPARA